MKTKEKTATEIEDDVFALLNKPTFTTNFSGELLKDGTRNINSDKEDVVVGFLTGLSNQIQTGVVNINFYVNDIDNGAGYMVKNVARCRQVERIALDWFNSITSREYWFEIDRTPQTFKSEAGDQHFVNVRLKFRRTTF